MLGLLFSHLSLGEKVGYKNCHNLYACICSWNTYKINQIQDKIGVFVSIVSTKIPFKGTGKEYIGDDISEIAAAVKVCCMLFQGF